MHRDYKNLASGFTLLEILVVIGIIGILTAVVSINLSDSGKQARDVERQADLRELQSAIELYKNEYGRYPERCPGGSDGWSGQPGTDYACLDGTNSYIKGDSGRPFSKFMVRLPTDPKLNGSDSGYVYRVNSEGTVYKIMAMNTVESDSLLESNSNKAYLHEFKSCDMRGRRNPDGSYGAIESYCTETSHDIGYGQNATVNHCRYGHPRFQKSYGLWGGFAPCTGNCSITSGGGANTTEALTEIVICR